MRRFLTLTAAIVFGSFSLAFADDPSTTLAPFNPVQPQAEQSSGPSRWRGTAAGSTRFLAFQHVYRIAFQEKTRRFLGGNFFSDYGSSLKGLGGWGDGDNTYTNYVLHPLQGAASGFVFLQSDESSQQLEFGLSGEYWRSRMKAFAFSALYGAQFELGPISEASIGNVGKTAGTMGFVDLVITPIGGLAWIVVEDALDRFVVRKLERKLDRPGLIRFLRVALNPTRSFANVMRLKLPWYRPGRELNKRFREELPPEGLPVELSPWDVEFVQEGVPSRLLVSMVIFVPA